MSEMIYILAASYDRIEDALADHQAVDGAFRHFARSHDFDATVVAKDETGKVEIVRRHDEPTRHATGSGFGWGFAAGAVAALFPAVGILGALAAGGGAGTISRRSVRCWTGATRVSSWSTARTWPTALRRA
jgi:uncharacterized membrane protein